MKNGKRMKKHIKQILAAAMMLIFLDLYVDDMETMHLFVSGHNFALYSAAFIGLFLWIVYTDRIQKTPFENAGLFHGLELIGCCAFALISMAGKFYAKMLSFRPHVLFYSFSTGVLFIIATVGAIIFYWTLMKTICIGLGYLTNDRTTFDKESKKPLYFIIDGQHVFLKSLCFILLIWLPQLIIRYPGAMFFDAWTSLHHYWNPDLWSSQHPVIYTLLLGKLVDWGISLGHMEWGIFIIIIGQVLLHLLVMAYTITVMQYFSIHRTWRVITLCFYSFLPIFTATATTALIDSGYCAFFLLLLTELLICLYDSDCFVKHPRHWFLSVISVVGLFLRYNGLYIMLLVLATLIIWYGTQLLKKQMSLKKAVLILFLFLVPAIAAQAGTKKITEKYVVTNVSSRAKNAMIMQQVARCVVEHPESFSEQDSEDIRAVIGLKLETISERYSPYSFDTIKGRFNVNATKSEMSRFRKLWLRLLKEHPLTCVNATLNQNYFLFSLLARNSVYYIDYRYGQINDKVVWDYSDLYTPSDGKAKLQEKLVTYYYAFEKIPIFGFLANQAIYTILLFVLIILCLTKKDKRELILLLPLLATLGITFVGPACLNHPRYTYPLVYSMPLMIGVASLSKNKLKHDNIVS